MPAHEEAVRFLIMGLGGGEMHGFLLKHFANAVVDSIDIDQTIIRVAGAYMGVDTLLCEYYSLLNTTTDDDSNEDNKERDTVSLRLDHRVPPVDPSFQCRSRIIHGDAKAFIQYLGSRFQDSEGQIIIPTIGRAEGTLFHQYDYIIFDAFDPTPFSFLTEYAPESLTVNPLMVTMSTSEMLSNMKQSLKPATGLAIFHVHLDQMYPTYLRSIHSAFGSHSVADFILSDNDHIIVGRNGFFTSPASTNDREKDEESSVGIDSTGTVVTEANEPVRSTNIVTVNYTTVFGSSITTTVSTVTTVNVSSTSTTASAYHPCEDPVGFAEYSYRLIIGRYGLGTNMAVSSKHSLLCQNFTYRT